MEEARIKLEKALQQLLTPDQYREIRVLIEAAIDEAEDDGWERGARWQQDTGGFGI